MSARLVLVIAYILQMVWYLILRRVALIQRTKSLPEEVSDIYDKDRYQQFLNCNAELSNADMINKVILYSVKTIIILLPIFGFIERCANKNLSLIMIYTFWIFSAIEQLINLPFDYYKELVIRKKYKLSKLSKRAFYKNKIIGFLLGTIAVTLIVTVFISVMTDSIGYTERVRLGVLKSFFLTAFIYGLFFLMMNIGSLIELLFFRSMYTFKSMEECALKEKILHLMDSSKKKVKRIKVYNESKKTNSKNAYYMSWYFYREIGIADNFLEENSERELLAVLSHEVGHIKHKKTLLEYIGIAGIVAGFLLMWFLSYNVSNQPRPEIVIEDPLLSWFKQSFGITVMNWYLLFELALVVYKPAHRLYEIITNFHSRKCEFEADQEAVKNGYGEDMIKVIKKVSSDELIDINPHPLIVVFYHDHPTFYQRIKRIRETVISDKAAYN